MEAASRTATPVADDDRTGRYNFIVSMEVDRVNPIVPVTVAGCPANRKGTQPKRLPSTLWTSRLPFAKGKSIVCPRPVRKLVLEFSSPEDAGSSPVHEGSKPSLHRKIRLRVKGS